MGQALAVAGLVAGLAGLCLQFSITIPASLAAGRSLPGSLVFFFGFFTILTNVAAVLVYAAATFGRPAWFGSARVRAGVTVAIVVVMIVYHLVLAQLWAPQGLALAADTILHTVTPLIYVAWWLVAGRDGSVRLPDIALWLVYPLAYVVFALGRGAIVGEYPYPFLDVTAKGAASVALSSLLILGLFVALGLAAVAADRWLPRRSAQS